MFSSTYSGDTDDITPTDNRNIKVPSDFLDMLEQVEPE